MREGGREGGKGEGGREESGRQGGREEGHRCGEGCSAAQVNLTGLEY